MSQKKIKQAKKFTVKQVLMSLEWGVEDGKFTILSPLTDEFVSIELSVIKERINGKT